MEVMKTKEKNADLHDFYKKEMRKDGGQSHEQQHEKTVEKKE
jgi:hypothetical protein